MRALRLGAKRLAQRWDHTSSQAQLASRLILSSPVLAAQNHIQNSSNQVQENHELLIFFEGY